MEPSEYKVLDEQEETYWWYRTLRGLVRERVAELLIPEASGTRRILDAGCGTGGMLRALAPHGRAFGLDFSAEALRFAREKAPAHLVRASVGRLPYRDSSFDLAVSLDVLYHRGVPDDLEALRELRRVLKPTGALILNLPAFEALRSSHDRAVHTARRYNRRGLGALLRRAGFRPRRITYWNSLLFPGLACWRWLRRGAAERTRVVPHSDVVALPAALNALLTRLLQLEVAWLRRGDLPCGLSLLAVAHPEGEAR